MLLKVFQDPQALSAAAAEWIAGLIENKTNSGQPFSWLLSGGNTPKQLYNLLASQPFRDKIDWTKLHIFFGDERVVPFEDERNNGRMAQQNLLAQVPVPKEQIHFISTDIDPVLSALEYEKMLDHFFADQHSTFDLSLLGMGEDGHVLSLFPGSALINEKNHSVASVFVPSQNMYRITLTPKLVNKSACTAFLATGKNKEKALREVLQGKFQPEKYPSQLIQPENGELYWFVDEKAAGMIG